MTAVIAFVVGALFAGISVVCFVAFIVAAVLKRNGDDVGEIGED